MRANDVILPDDRLYRFGYNTARELSAKGNIALSRLIKESSRELEYVAQTVSRALAVMEEDESYVALEWLCDNYYLVEREGRQTIRVLSPRLRVGLASEDGRAYPAVFLLMRRFLGAGSNRVDVQRLSVFLEGVQDFKPLSEEELSLVPAMLRLSLIRAVYGEAQGVAGWLDGKREDGGDGPPDGTAENLENSIGSLRILSLLDLGETLLGASLVERYLTSDPAGIYPGMDEKTREVYRERVGELAAKFRTSEAETAKKVLRLASRQRGEKAHVGWWLFDEPLGRHTVKTGGRLYIFALLWGSIFASAGVCALLGSSLYLLLLFLPVFEIVKNLCDFIVLRSVPPTHIPRMRIEEIPDTGRTLCAVSALLTGKEKPARIAGLLEQYHIANRDAGENLFYGILADMKDGKEERPEEDLAIIEAAKEAINRLNASYGPRFFLFLRPRVFNARDKLWMGRERKRGAIHDLTRLLRGEPCELYSEGSALLPRGIRYIIALDEDTRLSAGAAASLVGAMLHPRNHAVVDPVRRVVTRGYGILQPRIALDLAASNRSLFSRILGGLGGVDPYGCAMSDVYQDLFTRGIFTGKGIIDVSAYGECLDGTIPTDTVLSHDMLEGGYLRAGLIGDVELSDGFPAAVIPYFERAHRWARGDVQVSPWLFKRVKNEKGESVKNPLNGIVRFWIADNLRRLITPFFILLCIVAGVVSSSPELRAAGLVAFFALASGLILSGADMSVRGGAGFRYRFGGGLNEAFAAILRTLTLLAFLPFSAMNSLKAMFTALFRMRVTGRKMLEWVTAADAEARDRGSLNHIGRRMSGSVVLGLLTALVGRQLPSVLLGLVWIFSPLYAFFISRGRGGVSPLLPERASELKEDARLMFSYFFDLMNEENNFLPPDNLQIAPDTGVAARTSPTNIGLSLLCLMAGADLRFITREEAEFRIGQTVSTLERMEKWRGHLYNWYDTRTLEPLRPRIVSSVDSGNLCACLITLSQGLGGSNAASLRERVVSLLSAMRLRELFDDKRKLFYIGLDPISMKPTPARYDLLASEARILSYTAIAKGEAPLKHWGRLGRLLTTDGRNAGLASWTGSMFEYLMPSLLLPDFEGSLINESLHFCLRCQRERSRPFGIPWGVSESAFYLFDGALNYQYKAHGVQCLGLKRGLGSELVISPYSSYLALAVDPGAAFLNIRALKKLGITGKYGLYEAADFTQERVGDKPFRTIACYMAHHVGMSLLAVTNLLCGDVMRRRFTNDREIAAYLPLLKEKLPMGAVVFRNCRREVPEKKRREEEPGYYRHTFGFDAYQPRAHLLSNGSYHLLLTDSGLSRALCHGVKLYNCAQNPDTENRGVRMELEAGNGSFPLVPDGYERTGIRWRSEFFETGAVFYCEGRGISAEVQVFLPEGEKCEVRRVSLRNLTGEALSLTLRVYIEPVLAREVDFEAHPMFSKLFLRESERGNTVVVTRVASDGRRPSLALACDREASFTTSRLEALGRGGRPSSVYGASGRDGTPDTCILARVPLSLDANGLETVNFSLGFGEGERGESCAKRGLNTSGGTQYVQLLARHLGLDARGVERAMEGVAAIVFGTKRRELSDYIARCREGRSFLWRFGISGDFPLVTVLPSGEEDAELIEARVRRHMFLRETGLLYDLAILVNDGGDYRRTRSRAILSAVSRAGGERNLSVRAGLHVIDVSALSEGELFNFYGLSSEVLPAGREPNPAESSLRNAPLTRIRRMESGVRPLPPAAEGAVVLAEGSLSPIVQSVPLANRSFGYIAADSGCGHLWRFNSRQNKLTGWVNDPLAVRGAERLECMVNGGTFSLFMEEDGPARFSFSDGACVWERSAGSVVTRLTAFVPPLEPLRVMLLEVRTDLPVTLRWSIRPQMGEMAGVTPLVTGIEPETGAIYAKSLTGDYSPQLFALCSSVKPESFTCDSTSLLRGEYDRTLGAGFDIVLAQEYILTPVNGRAAAVFLAMGCDGEAGIKRLSRYLDEGEARSLLERTKENTARLTRVIEPRTGDKAFDGYISSMALYQTLICRIYARASYCQCGGAYGFRDQLQDCLALVYADPKITKYQIIRAAVRQYLEGDVQHWWHPSRGGRPVHGVRTRYSDDLLWLPYAVCEYLEKTGDASLLDIAVPYITSPPLGEEENERYENAPRTPLRESIYGHCLRVIEQVITRGEGAHGLPLILGGDWNDGFNRVGAKGYGESVWLGWFFSIVLDRFSPLCKARGEAERASDYRARAAALAGACGKLFDGFYPRGFFDSGEILGFNGEFCAIDSIAQSFAAFNPYSDKNQVKAALDESVFRLVDEENRLIKLFTPPFPSDALPDPGYTRLYPEGVRENGGQYTHAAVWLCGALITAGEYERGFKLLKMLLPLNAGENYLAERCVLASDVYAGELAGRGGWSWYTGAAGWYYRIAVELVLGIKLEGGRLSFSPRGVEFIARTGGGEYHVLPKRGEGDAPLSEDEQAERVIPAAGNEDAAIIWI